MAQAEAKRTVLVVEDDPHLMAAMTMILEELRLTVLSAENGQEALAILERGKPGLILLDMKMPVMDGWEFAKQFYARYGRGIPIVVVTAAEDARKRAAEIGADGYISKPFQIDEFAREVAKFVLVSGFFAS